MSDALVAEGVALVEQAEGAGATLRLLGGAAIVVHGSGVAHRELGDLDAVTRKAHVRPLGAVLQERGYEAETRFNALHGDRRLIFHGPAGKLDVFVDTFEMCHRIELGGRLAHDAPTIPVADLLLTKLQIVELNAKDAHDIFHLLSGLRVGRDSARPSIDPDRFGSVLAADWGWWRTVTRNLGKLPDLLSSQPGLAPPYPRFDALTQAKQLQEVAETVPKGLKWKTRARVGDRVRWYELPEEVDH